MESAIATTIARPQNTSVFRTLAAPDKLRMPLQSHPGRRPPVVKPVGTVICAGEVLTQTPSESDAAALSSFPGKIIGTVKATLCNGSVVDAVEITTLPNEIIELPAANSERPTRKIHKTTDLGPWIDRLLQAGVSSSRIGCPDLVGQLMQCLSRPIDTVLCCMLDSDPGLPLNASVGSAFPDELAAGIDLLSKLLGTRRVWVAADPSTPAAWFASLDPLIRADGLRFIPLRGDYPQADPTLLLHTLLKRKLRPGRLPVEQGVLLLDAPAAVAIGYRVLHERPMLNLPVVIRDHVIGKTHFLLAPAGTSLKDICLAVGIPSQEIQLRGGDFLRDHFLPSNAVIGAGELAIHVSPREVPINPDPCVRCGWCIEACPTRIHPVGLLDAAQHGNRNRAEKFGLDSCIECGICSYVCPSRLPLLSAIRTLKKTEFQDADTGCLHRHSDVER